MTSGAKTLDPYAFGLGANSDCSRASDIRHGLVSMLVAVAPRPQFMAYCASIELASMASHGTEGATGVSGRKLVMCDHPDAVHSLILELVIARLAMLAFIGLFLQDDAARIPRSEHVYSGASHGLPLEG